MRYIFKKSALILFLAAGAILYAGAADDSRLLRFPDINGNRIVFVYAGDIWTVNAEGGDAKRLTSHEGMELFPKISPDGQWIAFSGEYAGNRQIFIIPSKGGSPRQLTYYNSVGPMPPRGGYDNVVLDWTPDSKNILFRSNRTEFGERNGKYFTVSIEGGPAEPLQIVNGGMATFSPDASKICFTPVDREFRNWKRYKGGRATELWIYDLEKNKSEKITDFDGSDQWPVWENNTIYFASDRDLRLNIYSYNILTKETKKLTDFKKFDVLWPSGQNGRIVFENGGYLYKLNTHNGDVLKINVNINFDNPNRVPYYKNVSKNIHSYNISPTGKRVLFDARGDIFSVPAENGITENLTQTQGVREIFPVWSPDGKYITWYSDKSGEYEVYLKENRRDAKTEQITKGSTAWKNESIWSPDSKYILYSDRTLNLKILNIETKKETIISKAVNSEIRDYYFSPDSKWVAYSKESPNDQTAIWIYNIEEQKNYQVTDNRFSDYSPVFSKDGNYIFFLSQRDFNLEFSSFEFDYIYNNATKIYAIILKSDGPKIFKFKNDVEPVVQDTVSSKPETKERNGENKVKSVTVEIDFEGINNRIIPITAKTGQYSNLCPSEKGLLYIDRNKLILFDLKEEKSIDIMDNVRQAVVSADGKTVLYRSGSDFGITGIRPGIKAGEGKINLDGLEMKIDPVKEWQQIFTDGWRIFRDYFYVENLHGVDWKNVKDNYSELIPCLGHRTDLDFVLSEMVAESNTGHTYVNRGDSKNVKRVENGLLGTRLKRDKAADRYVIEEIYQGENWNDTRRSPLTEPGVDVNEGDYLISINGQNITAKDNPYRSLENCAEKNIEIAVADNPEGDFSCISVIKPVKSELEILYIRWVNQRRKMVDKLSEGRIGYIHVPNTSYEGNRELFAGMYAYHNKEALIIDDRYNGGGFIPDVMAELLERETLSYWNRSGLDPMKTPGIAHDGPKVMLINGYSSSGGDAFPYYFKKKGLGMLIGTRTWGGLVGISGNASLVDGGSISVPQFGIFDENGEWIIEGEGVYPDIEVVDRPEQLAAGKDPCIEEAVKVLLNELKKQPAEKVNKPKPPDRSGWIKKDGKH